MKDNPDLESKLRTLEKFVEKLPDSERTVGQTALELCQKEDITIEEYERQMKTRFPGLENREETRTYHKSILMALMMAERYILIKQDSEASQILQTVGAY